LAYYAKSIYLTQIQRANEAVVAADAGLAINPNFARLYLARAIAENALGRFEQAKSDVLLALRLYPRDPEGGRWHNVLASRNSASGISRLQLRKITARSTLATVRT
jgi:tetratricopeptide (TPR) repeat protein